MKFILSVGIAVASLVIAHFCPGYDWFLGWIGGIVATAVSAQKKSCDAFAPAWQTMGSAPKDGTDVLITNGDALAVAHWDGDEWRDMGDIGWGGMSGAWPTHWRPLELPQ